MITDLVTNHQGDILIVDDLPDNLRLLRDTLSEEGYKVRSATTGAMAIRAAHSPSTDLILLDIKLPDLDGYEVCRKLKSDGRTADIPVIFLSALNETSNKVQGLAAGGVDYISKPFQVQEVLARVAIHLTIRRLQKSLQQQNLRLIQEIEEHQQLKEVLFAEKELAQVTLQSIGDAVITTDAQENIRYFNPVAEKLTGWKAQEAEGLPLSEVFIIINEVTRKPADNPITKALLEGKIVGLANHTVLIARDGTEYAIEDSAAPIRDRQGEIIGAIIVFHDVTESRYLTRQLSWEASHDALTGLINRRRFEQYLMEAIASVQHSNHHHVLCYLDLDQFKVVNDTVGHIAGDELLRQITTLLQQAVRANDRLARLGGDEFGLLLTQCPLSQAAQIAEILKDKVRQFRFIWESKTFIVGVSIGVVAINKTNPDLMEILGAADAACYAAKAKGRNCIHIYHQDDGELIKQRTQRQLIAKISRALETHRFCLYYQKIVSITSKSLVEHYEVLLRMLDENGELIPPSTFIPAAERYGLITDIDCWVVETFFSNYKKISQQNFIQQSLYAINLSGASICNNGFLEFLIEQFPRYQIPPQTICFEITETAAIANFDQARYFMGELKEIGCRFALDDFGSGLSSFAYLINLPVDYLKIDGTFVKNINDNLISQAIVEGFNRIAHAMNLETVAEFVEDETILQKLREIGVDYAQGYGISHPVPINFNHE
ncbi:EAL domain-containing protein [Planktothrix paucivesiculata]|uniref:Response regulator receiver modulated diguanylate cyclase/phosphodiesterase with PAS/PAC sensor(S) n=1 Tax=Planktothrix paucivesiculata PCC 9631 TaxID=671071 RepID=A0A7Z9BKF5_9CYAN|nr:EAL domain-containing protein [Planktothrix paucivesiculata]VXD14534.1 Response regulator receiver modulated diguanylate cyclase/phosphodiesterase with PAS/PAC sensor(S) [Planktothrix paucivesiculata PCC 9631]